MYLIKKPKTLKHKLHAVSPVVATLVLIVVAIVGAIAVGLIMSRVANNTSSQANVANVSSNAASTLTIGGSTTVYPVTQSAVAAFEAEYPGVNVQVAQGGSGAGMEGVIIGAINIGEASSFPTVSSYSTSAAALTPPVNLEYTNIGGSGVVVIENGPAAVAGLVPGQGLLSDGANYCFGISAGALKTIYSNGAADFAIMNGACAAVADDSTLQAAGVVTAGTAGSNGPYYAVSRSDVPSGTQETFGAWIGISSANQDLAGMGTGSGETAVGNPGVLAAVQQCTYAGAKGCIGFTDLSFAEGSSAEKAQSVSLPALTTNAPAAAPQDCNLAYAPVAGQTFCYVNFNFQAGSSASTAVIHTAILTGLQGGTMFPDNNAGNNQLSRTFWYVTAGAPTPVEQDWINFMTNPGSTTFFTNQGYFSVYQYKTG
jgi:phosphate transport system substrate-binding protein